MVQHIAGRSSAKEKNANLIEAIKAAGFPHDRYQTTTIVNTDDAIPGTGMFVRNSIESNKSSSHGRNLSSTAMARAESPQLDEKSSAIVVLDKERACAVG